MNKFATLTRRWCHLPWGSRQTLDVDQERASQRTDKLKARHAASSRYFIVLVILLYSAYCGASVPNIHGQSGATIETQGNNNLEQLAEQYIDDYFAFYPHEAVLAGRTEFESRIGDFSKQAVADRIKALKEWKTKIEEIDFGNKEVVEFERQNLLSVIRRELFWLETAKWPTHAPMFYEDVFGPADRWFAKGLTLGVQRYRTAVQFFQAIPKAAFQIQENIELPMPQSYANWGRKAFGRQAAFFLKMLPIATENVADPEKKTEFANAIRAAAASLNQLSNWFESQEKMGNDEFALGETLFLQMLTQSEGIETTLGELERIGRRDLEQNGRALVDVCKEIDPNRSVAEIVAEIRNEKPPEGPVEAARRQVVELRRFITARQILTLPEINMQVIASPTHMGVNSTAFVFVPGPYERDSFNATAYYYITAPDPEWPKDKQRSFMRDTAQLWYTSIHEAYPGHILQIKTMRQSVSTVARLFAPFSMYEGWAHYTEEMMRVEGFRKDDLNLHVGQLLKALRRNCRFLAAVGLHCRGMTIEEAKQLFVDKAFHDEGNAEQQALRGTYDPQYLTYTLGKLEIKKLRDAWLKKTELKTIGEFHDKFLSYGGAPIPLIAKEMLQYHLNKFNPNKSPLNINSRERK